MKHKKQKKAAKEHPTIAQKLHGDNMKSHDVTSRVSSRVMGKKGLGVGDVSITTTGCEEESA